MAGNNNILNELNGLGSSLANRLPENVYEVPEGYFAGFPATMIARIKALESGTASEELEALSPLLASISKENPFSVPAGYFESSIGIPEMTTDPDDQTEEQLSPALSQLKNKNPYTVPEGYFDSFAQVMLARLGIITPAKVVSFNTRKIFRYAAAAVILGVIALGSVLYFTRDTIDPVGDPAKWVEKQMEKLPDDNIDEFIDILGSEEIASSTQPIPEVNQVLQNVSTEELDEFLEDAATTDEGGIFLN